MLGFRDGFKLDPLRTCSRNSQTGSLFDWAQWDANAPGRQGTIRWNPRHNKYLLMDCQNGQVRSLVTMKELL